MTKRSHIQGMAEASEGEEDQVVEPCLEYGCSPWRTSSQRAADLYESGVKLWRPEDLIDIEKQLARSISMERFTVRRVDGSVVHIRNPMFGVQKPIWKPYVKFQEYWHLVRTEPDGPSETYNCTYLVDWANQTRRNYDGPIENVPMLFQTTQKRWKESNICEHFKSQLRNLLGEGGAAKTVTKLICFGLGDLNLKAPDWWVSQNKSAPKEDQVSETYEIEAPLVQHAVALTMAEVIRFCANTGEQGLRILTQDPGYSDETIDMLHEIGFEVVGQHGAGGFAELDNESMVFSAWVKAPVKQIIANIARPVAIVYPKDARTTVYNNRGKPYADPESPRTKKMWKEYESQDFPSTSESIGEEGQLNKLAVYTRIEGQDQSMR